jgi:stage III sporulation protein AE
MALSFADCALHNDAFRELKKFVKWLTTWSIKIVLYIFTGYMGITGVVSGTTDAAALKAAKLTISGMVPVVGGILSDASESVLVGAGVMKTAAGMYGTLAMLAICAEPFLKIGVQYLMLKATAALCGIFGSKALSNLVQDFSSALGILLGMTGSACLMLLISTVCFMKGVG